MAIDEKTAALVAAQLTTAYTARMGVRQGSATHLDVKQEILETYLLFRKQVAEVPISKALQKVKLGGV